MVLKDNEVLFTSRVIQVLRDEGINIDSMNALAELFAEYGFKYAQRRVLGNKMKVLAVNYQDLYDLFFEFYGSGGVG